MNLSRPEWTLHFRFLKLPNTRVTRQKVWQKSVNLLFICRHPTNNCSGLAFCNMGLRPECFTFCQYTGTTLFCKAVGLPHKKSHEWASSFGCFTGFWTFKGALDIGVFKMKLEINQSQCRASFLIASIGSHLSHIFCSAEMNKLFQTFVAYFVIWLSTAACLNKICPNNFISFRFIWQLFFLLLLQVRVQVLLFSSSPPACSVSH